MTEWRELKTLQDVAAAQAAGEEIEERSDPDGKWFDFSRDNWSLYSDYRARPRKKTKTVVLREALHSSPFIEVGFFTRWQENSGGDTFVRWLDTPERVVEVEE